MTSTLVDTNILIEIVARDGDADRRHWSRRAYLGAAERGTMLINLVIWSELAQPFESEVAMQAVFGPLALQREALPWEAAFVAGQAHGRYRRNGGSRLLSGAQDRPAYPPGPGRNRFRRCANFLGRLANLDDGAPALS